MCLSLLNKSPLHSLGNSLGFQLAHASCSLFCSLFHCTAHYTPFLACPSALHTLPWLPNSTSLSQYPVPLGRPIFHPSGTYPLHHLSRSPPSTVEKKVTTRSIAQNGKWKKRGALPPPSSKKKSSGKVTGHFLLFPLSPVCLVLLTVLFRLWECQNI